MAPVLGIDLGTSYSSIAVCTPAGVEVFRDAAGQYAQPSIVSYQPGQKPLVGWPARERLLTDPENTIYSFKRLLGRQFNTPEVKIASSGFPYRVVEGPTGQVMVKAAGSRMTIPSIAAELLGYLKRTGEARLGHPVMEVVVTVPATFDEVQRESVHVACQLAQLKARRVINEPTAAALAFGYGRSYSGRVAVYDFGGGTFDFTVLEVQGDLFRVLGSGGDSFLGGDDVDQALAKSLASQFWHFSRVDLTKSVVEWQRLLFACERAKRELSLQPSARIMLPDVALRAEGPVHLDVWVTRDMLERVMRDLLDRSLQVCADTLGDAGLTPAQVDSVILVGGTTLMPVVRDAVQRYFGRVPDTRMDPLSAVASGAAIQGLMLVGATQALAGGVSPPLLVDVVPHSVGLATSDTSFERVIGKNAVIPAEQTCTVTTWQDNQEEMVLRVFQGEAMEARNNVLVGEVRLGGLPPGPRGAVSVEVTVAVDADGRVKVTARQPDSGRVKVAKLKLVIDDESPGDGP
jgi:molecular chaperone DnaK